jgi:predicted ATP-grasp superfamily ATP-dependent carboligase/CelD/BcsL family acetyltransferase involved in cellulose biosynthesis
MSNSKERILILDGHTNQALACVRSLGKAGYEVVVASHQRLPLSGWSRYCTGTFFIEEQTVDAFRQMRKWATENGVGLVLPLTERSCVLCNADRSDWEDAGIIVGCGHDEMLKTAFDKALTLERATIAGVRIPPTRVPESLADALRAVDEIGLPCVIKPRWSNAWDGKEFLPPKSPTYLNTHNHLAGVFTRDKQGEQWPLVQGFVAGQGKGVFALCDQGRVVAWFAHERLRDTRPTGSSSSLRRSIRLEPRLREPAERLLLELKWHGPAMVEFKDDGINTPCLMEINGRFWGSLQLAIDAGVDFPRLWVSILKGETVSPIHSYTEGLTLRWIWGDVKRLFFIMRGAPAGYPGTFPSVGQGLKELFGPQPTGTIMEMWRRDDWRPGVGEFAGALRELFAWRRYVNPARNGFAANGPSSSNGPNGPNTSPARIASVQSNGHKPARLTVREATAQEISNWDALVMQFDNYRVCHKRAWMQSLEASIKGHPLFLVYEKSGEIVGCLPGLLTSIGPLRLFGSPLQGWQTVGMGPVFNESKTSTAELMEPLVPFLEKSHGVHHVELISSTLDSAVLENLHFRNEDLPTYRARLYPDDENRTMRAMKESARRNVKRGIKLGLEVRFEEDESFVDEHYDQLREVFARGGNMVPFGKKRVLEFFRHMKTGGNLIAVSVYLPGGGPNIATGMFTVEGKELLLWMWTHRTQYRWYRPTELMTWTVMKKAMEIGCDTFDFMGRGDFKAKFGAELDNTKHRWTWSRYQWLAATRTVASRGYKWQQSVRGRMIRRSLFGGPDNGEADGQKISAEIPAETPVLKGAA